MNAQAAAERTDLISTLGDILGADQVITDEAERAFYSADVYGAGELCVAAIRPLDTESLARAARAATAAGYSLVPRGGGMSYTGGYTPVNDRSITVDFGAMNQIVEINADDMYVTAQAGVTWAQLYEALKPMGLRIPFFGTFSGIRATVGGGMSNGALFLGTARYGTGGDNALGLEVVLADGTIIKTGQASVRNGKPFYRTYGPDLTGLFIHDAGSLGLKTQATLRLMRWPERYGFLSFGLKGIETAARALSEIARSGAAEEAYAFDPESTAKNLATVDIAQDIKTLAGVVGGQGSLLKGLKAGAKLVTAGRDFVADDMFSIHIVCAGRSDAAVEADLELCREIAAKLAGEEIVNSIPMAVRANPFKPLNSVLGPKGDRWAALNAKVAHSDAVSLIRAYEALIEPYKARMQEHNVALSRLMIAIDTHAFSLEPVFHWFDSWLPVHRRTPEPGYLKRFKEPEPNPEASALVTELRAKVVDLFAEYGAASNQIGKTYPYLDSLNPESADLLRRLKQVVDADGNINPGALGL